MPGTNGHTCDEDWPSELEALREDPVIMLLGGVVWMAKKDSAGSGEARRFLDRVRGYCFELGDPGFAVLMAMGDPSTDQVDTIGRMYRIRPRGDE